MQIKETKGFYRIRGGFGIIPWQTKVLYWFRLAFFCNKMAYFSFKEISSHCFIYVDNTSSTLPTYSNIGTLFRARAHTRVTFRTQFTCINKLSTALNIRHTFCVFESTNHANCNHKNVLLCIPVRAYDSALLIL